MAVAYTQCLTQLRNCMRKMQDTLGVALGPTVSPASLRAQYPRLRHLHQDLTAMSRCVLPVEANVIASTRHERSLLVTGFTTLMTVLLPQLDRFGARLNPSKGCSIGIEQDLFWVLWNILGSLCYAFSTVQMHRPHIWSEEDLPAYFSLFTSFHDLLTWLLRISRSPPWMSMKKKHGVLLRNCDLILILGQPTQFLTQISERPSQICERLFNSLPPTLVPLICCIYCEQFGSLPPVVANMQPAAGVSPAMYSHLYTQSNDVVGNLQVCMGVFHRGLIRLISNLSSIDCGPAGARNNVHTVLTAPSTLQAMKAIIVRSAEELHKPPHIVELSLSCLNHWLGLSSSDMNLNPDALLPVADRVDNKDAIGLPLHLNPRLSKPALEADVRLLHALSKHMAGNVSLTQVCYEVQVKTVLVWLCASMMYPLPAEALSMMMTSFVGLAKQITQHCLQLMRHGKAEESRQRQQLASSLRRDLRPSTEDIAANLQDIRLARLGADFVRLVRESIFLLSDLQISIPTEHTVNIEVVCDPSDTRAGIIKRSNPVMRTLNAWCVTPGWAAAVEAIYRGQHHADNLLEVIRAAMMAAKSLQLLGWVLEKFDCTTLTMHISLAATIRKLIWPYLQHDGQKAVLGRGTAQRASSIQQTPVRNLRMEERALAMLPDLVPTLGNSAFGLDSVLGTSRSSCGSISNGSGSGSSNSSSSSSKGGSSRDARSTWGDSSLHTSERRISTNTGPSQSARKTTAAVQTTHGKLKVSGPTPDGVQMRRPSSNEAANAQFEMLLRLQFINSITLVKVLHWISCFQVSTPELLHQYSGSLATIIRAVLRVNDPDLRAVMVLLLGDFPSSAGPSQAEACVIWQRYAATHLRGAMLPGCCHLNCTNLGGVSEAALKTQLCGGCRRARYCSVGCQREAWSEGGHKTVCGI